MSNKHFLTCESVTEAHPDKLCDLISDMIVDDMLAHDPHAHVAAETAAADDTVIVFGEISTRTGHRPDVENIVREAFRRVGYTSPAYGTDAEHVRILDRLHAQSAEIDRAVGAAEGAGDQGLMIGYATDESDSLLPLPLEAAHRLAARLADVRLNGTLPRLRPDGKTQVTMRYEDDRPVGVDTILVSTQHDPDVDRRDIEHDIISEVILPVMDRYHDLSLEGARILVNPSGSFVLGGPAADAGLTGRKIVVDQYGGAAPVGGGALSGKDPSKVDRTGAYGARHVAVNIVRAGLARRVLVRIAYAIGRPEPIGVDVDTMGTGSVPDERIAGAVLRVFDLSPRGIIDALGLERPQYAGTAAYGHYGRPGLPWEKADRVDALRRALGA